MTDFNWNKRVENLWKAKVLGRDAKKLSAIRPAPYAERFINFMANEVFINEKDRKEDESKEMDKIVEKLKAIESNETI